MSNKTKNFTNTSSYEKKACRMPAWILKLKGRIDSRKGKGVCDEFLLKLAKKEATLEANATICAENALNSTRKAGASAIVKLSDKKMYIKNAPITEKSTSPQSIRANRASNAQLSSNKGAAKIAMEELSQINETIIYIDTILEERIEKIRNHTSEKCHAYISGVRAGKMPDYESPIREYANNALEIYHNKHNELDEKIHAIVSSSMKEAIV